MTVNYTTNLALGQPVTGTESGTWGDDVNNSVTSYLDIAIAGSLALTSASFTANALTLANTQGNSSATNIGATTAQYYVLRVSSLAANVTITAPSVSKTYLVVNADATYSVTVKASGQTGVSIAAGERATVYYNGTDYIKVTSSVVSNLTGTLPVANGGTGAVTLTGLAYGNGTSAFTVATAAQVVAAISTTAVTNATNATTSTTQSAKDSTTAIATTAFADRFRSFFTGSTSGTAAVTDRGCLLLAASGITVPASVFAAGDAFTIYNASGSNMTITQGSSLTMSWAGNASTGNRTLAATGLATVIFTSATACAILGGGLS